MHAHRIQTLSPRNEIDIPHSTSRGGELQGQIIKHTLRDNEEIPGMATGKESYQALSDNIS